MAKGDRLGEFELQIMLAVIALQADAYGAAILRAIEEGTGVTPAIGSVYAALARLLDKRLLTVRASTPEPRPGGRSRKCYLPTPRGSASVQSSITALGRMAQAAGLGL